MDEYKYGDAVEITRKGFYEGVKGILLAETGDGKYVIRTKEGKDLWFSSEEFKKVE